MIVFIDKLLKKRHFSHQTAVNPCVKTKRAHVFWTRLLSSVCPKPVLVHDCFSHSLKCGSSKWHNIYGQSIVRMFWRAHTERHAALALRFLRLHSDISRPERRLVLHRIRQAARAVATCSRNKDVAVSTRFPTFVPSLSFGF